MRFLYNCKYIWVIVLVLSSCSEGVPDPGKTAPDAAPGTWKKLVTRDVDMEEPEDTSTHHLKQQGGDTTLAELIIRAVKTDKMAAFTNMGAPFSTRLTLPELSDMMASKTDTIVVTDPVTGNNETKVVARDFQFQGIHKYRVLEEWSFNTRAGTTAIRILGIAPLMNLYTQSYSGIHAMFWVKYEDVLPVLNAYEQRHPDNTLAKNIWHDYFQSDTKPAAGGM